MISPHTHTHTPLRPRAQVWVQTHAVAVFGCHGVRPDVLYVGHEQVAVLRPPHLRAVDVLDHQAEEVPVPGVDQGPQVPEGAERMVPDDDDVTRSAVRDSPNANFCVF